MHAFGIDTMVFRLFDIGNTPYYRLSFQPSRALYAWCYYGAHFTYLPQMPPPLELIAVRRRYKHVVFDYLLMMIWWLGCLYCWLQDFKTILTPLSRSARHFQCLCATMPPRRHYDKRFSAAAAEIFAAYTSHIYIYLLPFDYFAAAAPCAQLVTILTACRLMRWYFAVPRFIDEIRLFFNIFMDLILSHFVATQGSGCLSLQCFSGRNT